MNDAWMQKGILRRSIGDGEEDDGGGEILQHHFCFCFCFFVVVTEFLGAGSGDRLLQAQQRGLAG